MNALPHLTTLLAPGHPIRAGLLPAPAAGAPAWVDAPPTYPTLFLFETGQ